MSTLSKEKKYSKMKKPTIEREKEREGERERGGRGEIEGGIVCGHQIIIVLYLFLEIRGQNMILYLTHKTEIIKHKVRTIIYIIQCACPTYVYVRVNTILYVL